MNEYKINFIYNEDNNINDIFIKVLKKEIKNFIRKIYKKNKTEKRDIIFLVESENDNI